MPKQAQSLAPSDSSVAPKSTDAPTSETESTAELDSIATALAANMPEVQPHAIEESRRQQQSAEDNPTDKGGARFDSAVHAVDAAGKPIITARGTFALKRGRKTGSAASAPTVASNKSVLGRQASATDSKEAQTVAAARAAGEGAAEMVFMVGRVIGGEEWLPIKNDELGLDERAMMRGAFGDYFVATGKTDIPPGVALTFVLLSYAGSRFSMPKTQTRFKTIKAKIVAWWVNRKLRKQGLTAEVRATEPQPRT